jgi:hypothetical protein
MEELLVKWQAFKVKIRDSIVNELTFDYSAQPEQPKSKFRFTSESSGVKLAPQTSVLREDIIEALSLWRFISREVVWDYCGDESPSEQWTKRKEVLATLLDCNKENDFINILLMIESMPTLAFRKMFWGLNIDFMSPESFWRRLSYSQMSGIKAFYHSFWEEQVAPEVIYRGKKKLMKKISREDILNSEFDANLRYSDTGAMSYSLLKWDFGFNAYPNGVNDDTKVVEISPLRFFSVKNQADDFIVNTEDGVYFWLYRKARSNYVVHHRKPVELKRAVCPGFWYTVVLQAWFWIVSPIWLLTLFTFQLCGHGPALRWYWMIPLFLPSYFTPAWCAAAGIKYFSLKYLSGAVEAVVDFIKDHAKVIKRILLSLVALIFVPILIIFLFLSGFLAYRNYGWFGAILFLVFLLNFITRSTVHVVAKQKHVSKPEKFQKYVQNLGWTCWYIYILQIVVVNFSTIWSILSIVAKAVGSFIANCAIAVYGGFALLVHEIIYFTQVVGPLLLIMFIPIILGIAIFYLNKRAAKNSWRGDNRLNNILDRLYSLLTGLLLAFCGISFLWAFYQTTTSSMVGLNFSISAVVIVVIISLFIERIILWEIRPRTKQAEKMAVVLKNRSGLYLSKWQISKKAVLKNDWLNSLSTSEKGQAIDRISILLYRLFSSEKERYSVLKSCLSKINKFGLARAEESVEKLQKLNKDIVYDVLIRMMFGYGFDDAVWFINNKRAAHQAAHLAAERVVDAVVDIIEKVFMVVFYPVKILVIVIRAIFNFIWWLLTTVAEYAKTLYRLRKLFTVRCPYVAPKRILKI